MPSTREILIGVLKAVKLDDVDLFVNNLSLLEDRSKPLSQRLQSTERTYKATMRCIDDSLLLCTIYNRYKMLETWTNREGILPIGDSYGDISLSLAEIMGYQDCLKELAKLFPRTHKRYSLFELAEKVLSFKPVYTSSYGKSNYNVDADILIASCKRILGNHINELNENGNSFLHRMISIYMSNETLSILLEIGCDINMFDRDGHTPFHVFCSLLYHLPFEPNYHRHVRESDFTRNIKLLILENPSVQMSNSVDYYVLRYEVSEFRLMHSRQLSHSELPSLPLSTLLYKHGFEFSCNIRDMRLNAEERTLLDQYRLGHGVRKLSEICRIVLRQHYTGRAIHRFVEGDNVPKQLKDYILLKDIIKL